MYSFIEGKIADLNPTTAILACQGIGYTINISLNTYTQINGKESCRLHTHLIVREDALILFGFADTSERHVFQQLISVSGVGPNTARLILSSLSPAEVSDAIARENVKLLQSIKGIGGKSALRIIIDLKDKIMKDLPAGENLISSHNTNKHEALSALVMLGFNRPIADKVLDQVIKASEEVLPVDQLIKNALKIL
ncbi:MAG: Holliday junction branch migration protein RuvA [Lentimicrobiaceae bacterium]|jgi:Holliday junction DNA helicase RuvA